jgi:hypothetical protein
MDCADGRRFLFAKANRNFERQAISLLMPTAVFAKQRPREQTAQYAML